MGGMGAIMRGAQFCPFVHRGEIPAADINSLAGPLALLALDFEDLFRFAGFEDFSNEDSVGAVSGRSGVRMATVFRRFADFKVKVEFIKLG